MRRSIASSEQEGNHYFLFKGFIFDSSSSIYLPKSVLRALISDKDGGPVHIKTLSIWFNVELPGKRGFPLIISPNKQPKLQMSIAFEYFLDPNRISGALYHLVAIYYVKIGMA